MSRQTKPHRLPAGAGLAKCDHKRITEGREGMMRLHALAFTLWHQTGDPEWRRAAIAIAAALRVHDRGVAMALDDPEASARAVPVLLDPLWTGVPDAT